MRGSFWLFGLLAGTLLLVGGCGGVDNADMMRVAKMRAQVNKQKGADSEAPAPPSPNKPAPPPKPQAGQPTKPTPSPSTPPKPAPKGKNATPPPTATPPVQAAAGDWQGSKPVDTSSQNLLDIAYALEDYLRDEDESRGRYMSSLHGSDPENQKLSWRVHLLPYLGYDALYERFDLNKAWNESPNLELAAEVPEIYQSDLDLKPLTRYLAVVGDGAVMGPAESPTKSEVDRKDGAASTVLVVEVDPEHSVVWTAPQDFRYHGARGMRMIGNLRGGYTYAVWADFTVDAINMSLPRRQVEAIFDYNGSRPSDRSAVAVAMDGKTMAAKEPLFDAQRSIATLEAAPMSSADKVVDAEPAVPEDIGPVNQLAADCLSAAAVARAKGESDNAWRWLYNAVIAGAPSQAWVDDVQWVPGLRRPSLGAHWAISVTSRSGVARAAVAKRAPPREVVVEMCSPYGGSLLPLLEKFAEKSIPTALKGTGGRPPITYLNSSATPDRAIRDANEAGADVLAVFEIAGAAGARSQTVEVALYDLLRGVELFRTSPLNLRSSNTLENVQDELKEVRWKLSDYLNDYLAPGDWPTALGPGPASRRIDALGKKDYVYPPRLLTEMMSYRSHELVDNAQLLQGVNELIGDNDGISLLFGDENKKWRVIRRWLPSDDPAAYVASGQSRVGGGGPRDE